MRNFREYEIWKRGMEIATTAYQITKHLPKSEEYGLSTQIRRASISIPSNIAEGCSRSGDMDFKRFLEMSLGSAYEVETQINLAIEMDLISVSAVKDFLDKLNSEQKQISSLINTIKGS